MTALLTLSAVVGPGVAGCYWYRYGDLMRTHMEVLAGMVGKLCSQPAGVLARRGGATEYTYPLQRAQDFARVAAKRCPDRPSLARFRQVLTLYGEIVARAVDHPERACAKQVALAEWMERVRRSLSRENEHCT